jgi:phage/plasmid-like protein (TIGR03299 family)
MAAELAYVNGAAQMFSVIETPWHKEGVILSDHPDYDTAITLSGFNYPLEKRPHFRRLPDGTEQEAADSFYVWRPDTAKVLGSVGGSYEVVPNLQAFEVLKPLVNEGAIKLETGGVLRHGADAWLLGRWNLEKFGPNAQAVFGGEIIPFATVLANHDGRRGILLGLTPVRIVCSNTLGQAETSGQSRWTVINHRAGAGVRLVEAAEAMFAGVVQRYEVIAAQYKRLMACALADADFARLVLDVIAPMPQADPKFNPEAKLARVVVERAEKKRARVTDLWTGGKGHTGEKNAWFALNAAVEALDHDRELWPTRAGAWRTASLLEGSLGRMKNGVLDGLVALAQGA